MIFAPDVIIAAGRINPGNVERNPGSEGETTVYRLLTFVALVATIAWFVTDPGPHTFIACVAALAARFRDEIHGVVGRRVLSLTPRNAPIRNLTHHRYSFQRSEFVNPRIIEDLAGWISDHGDEVVSVNIRTANESNRYFGKVSVTEDDQSPLVAATRDGSSFAYQYVGRSYSGVHLVRTWSSGGGSGTFGEIMLLTLSAEPTVTIDTNGTRSAERFIVKKIASVPLGDRYEGRISYRWGLLTIGPCTGLRALRTRTQRLLLL
jgi:hypothetical protein